MSRSRKREAKTAIQEDAASIREDLRHVDQEPALAVAAYGKRRLSARQGIGDAGTRPETRFGAAKITDRRWRKC
jgi:hypothetical protein